MFPYWELQQAALRLSLIHISSKLKLAEKWRNEHPEEKAIYIGDTSHDAESAEIIGAECLLLAGGHEGICLLYTSQFRRQRIHPSRIFVMNNGK